MGPRYGAVQTTPPMPFTEWPYGAATAIGTSGPNSADSPLMVALANTELGKAMSDAHIQMYGWVNPGVGLQHWFLRKVARPECLR
jgi:hypothetical protein